MVNTEFDSKYFKNDISSSNNFRMYVDIVMSILYPLLSFTLGVIIPFNNLFSKE